MTPVSAELVDNSEDTEITLGTGKMLALFFGLVTLCATFFGMGYSMGRNVSKTTAELLPSPITTKPDRALQPASSVTTTSSQPDATTKGPDQTTSSATGASGSTPSVSNATPDPNASPAQSGTQSAGQSAGQPAPGTQAPPAAAAYFVQVAAVSKQEDAQALVDSLKGRQYQAFVADPAPDKLFHVQVGPFTDVKDAETMRTRLVNDGYNPILKK